MRTEVVSIDKYLECSFRAQFDFIFENLSIMESVLRDYKLELVNDVIEQKECNRKSEWGELGVRVMMSFNTSSPTERMGINNSLIGKAIEEKHLDEDFFKDTDDRQDLIRRVTIYHKVKDDMDRIKSKMSILPIKDQRVIRPYILGEITLMDLSEQIGIDYRSTVNKLYRIKQKLMNLVQDRKSEV